MWRRTNGSLTFCCMYAVGSTKDKTPSCHCITGVPGTYSEKEIQPSLVNISVSPLKQLGLLDEVLFDETRTEKRLLIGTDIPVSNAGTYVVRTLSSADTLERSARIGLPESASTSFSVLGAPPSVRGGFPPYALVTSSFMNFMSLVPFSRNTPAFLSRFRILSSCATRRSRSAYTRPLSVLSPHKESKCSAQLAQFCSISVGM